MFSLKGREREIIKEAGVAETMNDKDPKSADEQRNYDTE